MLRDGCNAGAGWFLIIYVYSRIYLKLVSDYSGPYVNVRALVLA